MGRRPKPRPAPLDDAEAALFGQFWAAYPLRPLNPRRPAEVEFARALEAGHTGEALVAAAAAFARQVAAEGVAPTYRPHARTWLAQQRYLDFLPAEGGVSGAVSGGGAGAVSGGGTAHPLWPRFRGLLSPELFASWIAPLGILALPEGGLLIRAPSRFVADRVRSLHAATIERAMGARIARWEVTR